jgi:hypothetical protein
MKKLVFLILLGLYMTGSAETGMAQISEELITVKNVAGQVTFVRELSDAKTELKVGMVLNEKDIITTEGESSAELILEDSSTLTIDEYTLVTLSDLKKKGDKTKTVIKLTSGKILFDVKRQTGQGTIFRFDTPHVQAAVKGSKGGIETWKTKSFAFLETGKMKLSSSEEEEPVYLNELELVVKGPEGINVNKSENKEMLMAAVDSSEKDLMEEGTEPATESEAEEAPPEAGTASETETVPADNATESEPESAQEPEPEPKQEPGPEKETEEAAPAQQIETPGEEPVKEPEKKEEEVEAVKKEEEKAEAEKEGFQFNPGLTFGAMTRNGQTWTRFSFRPEIAIGKFGVALDLELFMNDEQKFDSYGWKFDSFDNTMESLYRKVYYVRWAYPGDKLYLKLGALDNVTLGYGLIMSGYGNTALYPDKKLLGFHGQLNHISALDANLEVVLNSFRELQGRDAVVGARLSIAPLSKLGLPLISKIRIGASAAGDLNQLGGLPDRDGDNCPDELDLDPEGKDVCKGKEYYAVKKDLSIEAIVPDSLTRYRMTDSLESSALKRRYGDGDQFSALSFDVGVPILSMKLISLEVYSELALQMYQNSDDMLDGGYGLILPGARAGLGPVSVSLEYRYLKQPFFPGHFNSLYEAERVVISGDSILTKEQKYWSDSADVKKGIYGALGVDLKGLLIMNGHYCMMFPDKGDIEHGYSGRVALGESITKLIPKISSGEIFWVKERVGQDKYRKRDEDDPRIIWIYSDAILQPSIFTYWGYAVGIQMGSNMIITIKNTNTYVRDENLDLQRETNLSLETAITF